MKRLVGAYCVLVLASFAGLIILLVEDAIANLPIPPAIGYAITIAPSILFLVGIPLCFVVAATVRNNQILPCVALTGIWSALMLYGWIISQALSAPR